MNDYKKIQDLFEGGEINIRKVILIFSALEIETGDCQLKSIIRECLSTLNRIEILVMEELHGIIDPKKISQISFQELSKYCKMKIEEISKPSSKILKFISKPPAGNHDENEILTQRYQQ
jgi:hypothetical protein